MSIATEAEAFDAMHMPWSWCGRCQRTYPTGTCRMVRFASDALHTHPTPLKLCPYDSCDASTARYQWQWANVRLQHPEYPVTPLPDVIYLR